MEKKIVLIVTITIILLIFLVPCILSIRQNHKTKKAILLPRKNSFDDKCEIPLSKDDNGMLIVKMIVNEQMCKAVLDTGSTALVIADKKCDSCMVTSKISSSLLPCNLNNETIVYGSQTDVIKWCQCGACFVCEKLNVCLNNVYVAFSYDRTGESSYNILGLGKPLDKKDFLNNIEIDSFMVDISKRKLVLHKILHKYANMTYLPIYNHINIPKHFYTLQCLEFIVGNRIIRRNIPVIFDLGSNMLSFPNSVRKEIIQDLNQYNKKMRLVFGQSFTLNYTHRHYKLNNQLLVDREKEYEDSVDSTAIIIGSMFIDFKIHFSTHFIGFQ
jgi:hypothetical protein